jgi:hypothetical protein
MVGIGSGVCACAEVGSGPPVARATPPSKASETILLFGICATELSTKELTSTRQFRCRILLRAAVVHGRPALLGGLAVPDARRHY